MDKSFRAEVCDNISVICYSEMSLNWAIEVTSNDCRQACSYWMCPEQGPGPESFHNKGR